MNTEELTQIVTAHQQAIVRHEQALAATMTQHNQEIQDIRAILNQVGTKLDQVGTKLDQVATQQDVNTHQIARLTENLLQLGNFVADDIQRRSQP